MVATFDTPIGIARRPLPWPGQHWSTPMDSNSTKGATTHTADGARDTTPSATGDQRPRAALRPDARDGQGASMNAADLEGRAVISVATGARLGRVEDVL